MPPKTIPTLIFAISTSIQITSKGITYHVKPLPGCHNIYLIN
ncbi:hypothetical protein UUU_07790 [Klebsiella pneumoniae subsp. pneumoniae DSM 30104 = JCM 1662 = NBRC 14940]|nr:hypothetical protein UUU_07790 [Klebsiella pneumoniae subsp. pneumoniae DSM 30104 = JCM 1662 = NBRC 14940]